MQRHPADTYTSPGTMAARASFWSAAMMLLGLGTTVTATKMPNMAASRAPAQPRDDIVVEVEEAHDDVLVGGC